VYWITEYLGIKAVNEDLREEEFYDSIIYDLRHLVDGKNNPSILRTTVAKLIDLYEFCICNNIRLVLQCPAGISRSNALATFLLSIEKCIPWEESLSIVKKNCGRKYKIRMNVYLEGIEEDEYSPCREAEKKIVVKKDD